MAMTKNEFRKAIRDAASAELAQIPAENSIDYTFSDAFERNMKKLIRNRKKSWYPLVSTAARRVAVILLICAVLVSSAFSVEAVWEPIQRVIQEFKVALNGELVDFSKKPVALEVQGDPGMTLATRYAITELPEGFVQTDYWYTENFAATSFEYEYENGEGVGLYFSQAVFREDAQIVDSRSERIAVNGKQILFLETKGHLSAYWVEEGKYMISLDAYNGMDRDVFMGLIASIKPAE